MSKSDGTDRSDKSPKSPGWIYAKRPVLAFVVLFGVLMGGFYGLTALPAVDMKIIPAYMRLNAVAASGVVNVVGEEATARGTTVSSSRFSVDIQHGCDAIAPTLLFASAVLAFPAPIVSKLIGVAVGSLILAVINLFRIIALFFTGIYFPKAFEIMHVDVWQPVFILLALTLWIAWAWWATGKKATPREVSVQTS